MHHILRGVLGAALVYPVVWYHYSHSGPVQPSGGNPDPAPAERQANVGTSWEPPPEVVPAPQPQDVAPSPPAQRSASAGPAGDAPEQPGGRTTTQRVALPAPPPALPKGPRHPGSPDVPEPKVPFPAFAELQEAFGQMKDLQEVSHDPKALDERLQSMQHDPQKLARLKAFAEQLVNLPPPPAERYLPTGNTSRPDSAR